jgi:hypothetical protein
VLEHKSGVAPDRGLNSGFIFKNGFKINKYGEMCRRAGVLFLSLVVETRVGGQVRGHYQDHKETCDSVRS